jgi:hypothetical protein
MSRSWQPPPAGEFAYLESQLARCGRGEHDAAGSSPGRSVYAAFGRRRPVEERRRRACGKVLGQVG